MTEKNFKIGDTVALKVKLIASPTVMLVTEVSDLGIKCLWYAPKTEEFKTFIFPENLLKIITLKI